MPVVLDTQGAPPHLVLRRLDRHDLRGLAELLPSALGGDVEPWTDGTACP